MINFHFDKEREYFENIRNIYCINKISFSSLVHRHIHWLHIFIVQSDHAIHTYIHAHNINLCMTAFLIVCTSVKSAY